MIFFTADTHFGHENILKLCNRPFSTVENMNETMIAAWNGRITGADTVLYWEICSFAARLPRKS